MSPTPQNAQDVRAALEELDRRNDFVIANGLDDTTNALTKGYAVDSIFYAPNDETLTELRVWFARGELYVNDCETIPEFLQHQ